MTIFNQLLLDLDLLFSIIIFLSMIADHIVLFATLLLAIIVIRCGIVQINIRIHFEFIC